MEFYRLVIDQVVPVTSTRAAEMKKLLENIPRSVTIGLVNETKIVCDTMGIDIFEVIRAASTNPFGFTAYCPRPGLGSTVNSAVVIMPVDAYFNAGWWGVALGGIFLALVWSILAFLTSLSGYKLITWYFRGYFFSVIAGSGMIQGFFTVAPLFLVFGLEIFSKRLRAET